MKTFRQYVIDDVYNKLAEITIENGYHTDIGLNIYRGKVTSFSEEDFMLILDETERVIDTGTRTNVRVSLEINVLIFFNNVGLLHPYDTARVLLGDVQASLFSNPDIRIAAENSVVRTALRYEGSDISNVEQEGNLTELKASFVVQYVMDLSEPFLLQ